MKTYPKMKKSGILEIKDIPEEWEIVRFDRCLDKLESGNRETGGGSQLDNGIPSIGGEHITRDNKIIFSSPKYISEDFFKKMKYGKIKINDILLVKDGATIGKTAIYGKNIFNNAAVNEHVFLMRTNEITTFQFAFFYIISKLGQDQIKQNIRGAAQGGLNSGFTKACFLALPSINEQNFITTFLNKKISQFKIKLYNNQKLVKLLREKKQSLIIQAVTKGLDLSAQMKDSGIEGIGKIPEHWKISQLKHIVKLGTSITYGILQPEDDVSDGIPYIQTKDMKNDYLPKEGYFKTSKEIAARYKRSQIHEGDIIVAIRATIGKVLMIPSYLDGANIDRGPAKITPNENTDGKYLFYCLNAEFSQEYFKTQMKGATFKEITLDALRRNIIPLPPKEEQHEISKFIDAETKKINFLISNIISETKKIQEHRQVLISLAITGKIDVREAII